MTYQFKGFINYKALVRNAKDDDSAVGEISTQSLTYSRDIGVYNDPTYPDVRVYSFASKVLETGPVAIPELILERVSQIADWIFTKQMAGSAPTTRAPFLADLTAQYTATANSIDCGEMVNGSPGVFFPEWVRLSLSDVPEEHLAHENTLMFWLVDASFRNQYDERELAVVPPLPNIDVFFQGRAAVAAALAAYSQTDIYQAIEVAKGGDPITFLSGDRYDYVNPVNANDRLPTVWTLLGWGKAGDDIDVQRQTVRDYITEHSTHTENEWRQIFPDIFQATEILVFPRWFNYAIEDMSHTQGVYSPTVSLKKELDYVKLRLPTVDAAHIDANTQVIPTQYKSLALVCVGGPDNRQQLYSVTKLFPDLLNVPTSDSGWAMQSPKTAEWVQLMARVLLEAERATAYSDLPTGMRKVTRSNVMYITAKYDNVQYLVASKGSTPNYL